MKLNEQMRPSNASSCNGSGFPVIGGFVQYAFALGDEGRDEHLACDIDGGAAHVEDRIDGEQQAGAFERKAKRRERKGEHHDRAGQARRGSRPQDRDEDDHSR